MAKWSNQQLQLEAAKYANKSLFIKGNWGAYKAALRRGIIDQICGHMPIANRNWLSKDSVLIDAQKYKTKSQWRKNSPGAALSATKNGWFNEATLHMPKRVIPPAPKWTKEAVLSEARKYASRYEWSLKNFPSYSVAIKKNWLEESAAHMKHGMISTAEAEIIQFVKSIHADVYKKRFSFNKLILEIDIFVPELMLGIEYDGDYWHSGNRLARKSKFWSQYSTSISDKGYIIDPKVYHSTKDRIFLDHGISILHVSESEWRDSPVSVKNKIVKFLGQ